MPRCTINQLVMESSCGCRGGAGRAMASCVAQARRAVARTGPARPDPARVDGEAGTRGLSAAAELRLAVGATRARRHGHQARTRRSAAGVVQTRRLEVALALDGQDTVDGAAAQVLILELVRLRVAALDRVRVAEVLRVALPVAELDGHRGAAGLPVHEIHGVAAVDDGHAETAVGQRGARGARVADRTGRLAGRSRSRQAHGGEEGGGDYGAGTSVDAHGKSPFLQ